jgi:hypothetical protein
VGATATAPAADPDPRVEEFRDTPSERGHSSEASETVRQVSRASQRQPHGPSQTPSGAQNRRLSSHSSLDCAACSSPWFSDNRLCLACQAVEKRPHSPPRAARTMLPGATDLIAGGDRWAQEGCHLSSLLRPPALEGEQPLDVLA